MRGATLIAVHYEHGFVIPRCTVVKVVVGVMGITAQLGSLGLLFFSSVFSNEAPWASFSRSADTSCLFNKEDSMRLLGPQIFVSQVKFWASGWM